MGNVGQGVGEGEASDCDLKKPPPDCLCADVEAAVSGAVCLVQQQKDENYESLSYVKNCSVVAPGPEVSEPVQELHPPPGQAS